MGLFFIIVKDIKRGKVFSLFILHFLIVGNTRTYIILVKKKKKNI